MVKTIDPAQRELVKGLLVGWGKTEEEAEKLLEGDEIKVNENGDVTKLHLCFKKLTGKIPASIGQLSNLTTLELNKNQLTGEIPASIGQLSNLTRLSLNKNQLTGKIPESIGQLSCLRLLYLDKNQLTGEIPVSVGELSNLKGLSLDENENLAGHLPVDLPKNCCIGTDGTNISPIRVRTRKVDTESWMETGMIYSYVGSGYADLIMDIVTIVQLIGSKKTMNIAIANIIFVIMEPVFGFIGSGRSQRDFVLNFTFLIIAVEGWETLNKGWQTPALIFGKKMSVVTRSLPGMIIQLYALFQALNDLNDDDGSDQNEQRNILIGSIASGIFGASLTLSGLHPKVGDSITSKQFCIVAIYYYAEIMLRVIIITIMFCTMGGYAFLVLWWDVNWRFSPEKEFLDLFSDKDDETGRRRLNVRDRDEFDQLLFLFITLCRTTTIFMLIGFRAIIFVSDQRNKGLNDISEACLFFGSDNAYEDDYLWMMGSAITFVEMVVFQIVLFTIDASNNPLLQAMRESGTARTLSIIIWVCFLVKHYTHYYIGYKMSVAGRNELKEEKKNPIHEQGVEMA